MKIDLQHWKAGRGSNNWEGWNIIALEEFGYPSMYMHTTLTSLIPDASELGALEREHLWQLHSASETLQMLYRGRQPLAKERGWPREPDVITLYTPRLFELADHILTSEDTTHFPKRHKRTTKPRFAQLVQQCGTELHLLFGAIPFLTFRAIGLEQRKSPVAEVTLDHVKEKIRQLVAASHHPLPRLREWAVTGELPGHENTRRAKRNGREEFKQAMQVINPSFEEFRNVRPIQTPAGINRVPGTVLAESEIAAQAAINTLFDEL